MRITNFLKAIHKKVWRLSITNDASIGVRASLPVEEHRVNYDVFISHASEDKAQVALPLTTLLKSQGFQVWLDQPELTVGDSLRCSIDDGLSASRFGIVVLSPDFLRKRWTNLELDGLIAREEGKQKVILPVLHNLSREDVLSFSPILASKVSVSTAQGLDYVAREVMRAIRSSGLDKTDIPPSSHRAVLLEKQTAEELSELRKQMIASQSPRDLQEVSYKLDEFLTRYPNNPEAQLLKNDVNRSQGRTLIIETAIEKGAHFRIRR
jgi:TIR domain.